MRRAVVGSAVAAASSGHRQVRADREERRGRIVARRRELVREVDALRQAAISSSASSIWNIRPPLRGGTPGPPPRTLPGSAARYLRCGHGWCCRSRSLISVLAGMTVATATSSSAARWATHSALRLPARCRPRRRRTRAARSGGGAPARRASPRIRLPACTSCSSGRPRSEDNPNPTGRRNSPHRTGWHCDLLFRASRFDRSLPRS